MNKIKNTALYTIIFIIVFNIGTKFLGFYRDAVIGRMLGAQIDTDAYLMALSATTLIFLSVGSGISTTLIPIIVKETDKERRREIINNILNFILLVSIAIVVIYMSFTNFIVGFFAGGFEGQKLLLTTELTKILIPTIIFINVAYMFVGILQSNENYILPTMISVPYNLIIILYLFTAVDTYGVKGLAVITVVGWALQMLVQLPKIISLGEVKWRPTINFKNEELRIFIKGLLPVVFVMATNQLATVTDNSFISYFGDGKLTTFYYANMLFIAISTIIVYGITAVMFPKFNKSYVENKEGFYNTITTVLEGIILLLVPIGVGIALVSDELISLIFLSDEFTVDNVVLTANFLKIYGLFMVAFGIMDIMNKAYYTKDDRQKPVIISVVILVTNLILNSLFTRVLDFGIYSIVLATAISFYVGIFISLFMFKSDDGNIQYKKLFITIGKSLISAILMYILIVILQQALYNIMAVDTIITRMVFLSLSALMGMVVYFGSLILLKEKIIIGFIKSIIKK